MGRNRRRGLATPSKSVYPYSRRRQGRGSEQVSGALGRRQIVSLALNQPTKHAELIWSTSFSASSRTDSFESRSPIDPDPAPISPATALKPPPRQKPARWNPSDAYGESALLSQFRAESC